MKKKLLLVFSICLAIVLFIIVGGAISGDHLSTKKPVENEKIHIGVFEPLTGINSVGGKQELLGLEYARSQRPTVKVDGVTYDIEFVVRDNASEATAAERAAKQLVASEVSAVLGSYGSAVSIVGGRVFMDAAIPAIGISCTNPAVTADNALYFRTCFTDDFQGKVMAKYVYGTGLRTIAVVTQAGDAYSKGLGEFFSAEIKSLGGEVLDFSFNSVQTNFEDLARELTASDADGVYMPSSPVSAGIFVRQARGEQMNLPVFAGDTWDSQTLIDEIGTSGKNVYFSSSFDSAATESGAGFAAKFSAWVSGSEDRLERNGGSSYATPVAALAYDAYTALVNAIENANSYAPDAIALQLQGYSFSGVTGDILFDTLGNPQKKAVYIKTINVTAKRFDLVQTMEPAK